MKITNDQNGLITILTLTKGIHINPICSCYNIVTYKIIFFKSIFLFKYSLRDSFQTKILEQTMLDYFHNNKRLCLFHIKNIVNFKFIIN